MLKESRRGTAAVAARYGLLQGADAEPVNAVPWGSHEDGGDDTTDATADEEFEVAHAFSQHLNSARTAMSPARFVFDFTLAFCLLLCC